MLGRFGGRRLKPETTQADQRTPVRNGDSHTDRPEHDRCLGAADRAVNADHWQALQDAWVAFLSAWTWEWFCTLTFREVVPPEAADKRYRLLVSLINRQLFGPRWFKKGRGMQWTHALEYQRREVIHCHGLVAGVGDLRQLTWYGYVERTCWRG